MSFNKDKYIELLLDGSLEARMTAKFMSDGADRDQQALRDVREALAKVDSKEARQAEADRKDIESRIADIQDQIESLQEALEQLKDEERHAGASPSRKQRIEELRLKFIWAREYVQEAVFPEIKRAGLVEELSEGSTIGCRPEPVENPEPVTESVEQ